MWLTLMMSLCKMRETANLSTSTSQDLSALAARVGEAIGSFKV